ncbi:hypothetical protein DOTSEDRAFT_25473 [Dothistroma septosporum NZE10]|uniref:Uncharacterized protein n=1 Tax=Dothistroma septosporum (strain NZE10 / CBS 128990) TaxID=675120 RepID=M2YPK0_DOTSN|nr:hypothetical protein DOTSEDRAFT_25473 [Dothistroma septosporum NZE10]
MSGFNVKNTDTTPVLVESGPIIPDCRSSITSGLAAIDVEVASAELNPYHEANGPGKGETVASQVFPRFRLLLPREPIIVDFEYQDYHIRGETHHMDHRNKAKRGKRKCRNRVAWICARNSDDVIILDCFVRYDYEYPHIKRILRPEHERFGVTAERLMERNGAVDGRVAEGRSLNSGKNDLQAFYYKDPFAGASEIIDTQHIHGQRSLSAIYLEEFGEEVQKGGQHTAVEDTAATNRIFKLNSSYNREAEQADFNKLTNAEKEAYYATGPFVKFEHYQGNKVLGMPARQISPKSITRKPRAYKGKVKPRATANTSSDEIKGRGDEMDLITAGGQRGTSNITLTANGDINLTAGRDINLNARGGIKVSTGGPKMTSGKKTASKGFSLKGDEPPVLGKK